MPVVGFIRDGTADASARYVAAFRKGLVTEVRSGSIACSSRLVLTGAEGGR
jgi:hypothetical protein